jgi:hypothetical protein
MALTTAHPGIVRWCRSLWLTDPDAKNAKRRPQGPPLRGGSPWAYVIVAAVFALVILAEIHVPWRVQKLVAGWVPGADVEGGFTGLLAVAAVVVLGVIAWVVYGKCDEPTVGVPVRTRVSVSVFEDVAVEVTDGMAWNDLWNLADSIENLSEVIVRRHPAYDPSSRHRSFERDGRRRSSVLNLTSASMRTPRRCSW